MRGCLLILKRGVSFGSIRHCGKLLQAEGNVVYY